MYKYILYGHVSLFFIFILFLFFSFFKEARLVNKAPAVRTLSGAAHSTTKLKLN